jgi:hypothetical protein
MSGSTPQVRSLSVANLVTMGKVPPISTRHSNASPLDLCGELRHTIESNQGSLDVVSEKLLKLVEMLEGSFVQSLSRDTPSLSVSAEDVKMKHLEKLERLMKLIPDKRLSKVLRLLRFRVI